MEPNNSIDWTEKRFQIVLSLLNAPENPTIDTIKQTTDQLMEYLQEKQQSKEKKNCIRTIRKAMEERCTRVEYEYTPSSKQYKQGVGDAFTYIKIILDKLERQYESGTK